MKKKICQMEDSKSQDHYDEISDKKIEEEKLEIENKEANFISKINNEIIDNKNLKNLSDNNNDKTLENNKNVELSLRSITNLERNANNIEKSDNEKICEIKLKDNKSAVAESNSNTATNKLIENINSIKKDEAKEKNLEDKNEVILKAKSNINADKNNPKKISTTIPVKAKTKPVKEPPIEKKPFLEFVNDYLIPEIKNEFKKKGKQVNKINLKKTNRPIAQDICWVIYCEINDTCNFWLSFEKDDITSLKSFSLCKNYEKPSIIESFLIDEKKITLKLIISRILQRLNGQKLFGAN